MDKVLLKIGVNTIIQSIGKVISVALSIATVFLLTRYLGSSGYGNFTLAFTYVSFFSVFADFGLQSTLVREFSQKGHNKKEHESSFLLKTLLVCISSICAFIVLWFFPYEPVVKIGISIAILAVAVSGISSFGNIIFQSKVRLDLITVVDLVTKVATVFFTLIFIYFKLNIFFIILTVLLGNIIGLILTFFLLKNSFKFHYDSQQIKKIFIASFPVGISAFLGLAYFKVDTIMLSVLRNSNEVGIYTLPYKVLENVLVLWGFYMASVFPLIAKFNGEKNKKEIQKLFKQSFFLSLILSMPIIILGILFSPAIIYALAGNGFSLSIYALRILLMSLPFLFINVLLSDLCIVFNESKMVIYSIAISLIFNVLLNLWLIPLYGFIGASYATVLSAMMQTVCSIILIQFSGLKAKIYDQ